MVSRNGDMTDFLSQLHDASLLGMSMDWSTGELTIVIRTWNGTVTLTASGTTLFVCPRAQPWGRSVSIHHATYTAGAEPESAALEIEMQSGDLLRVLAASFTISGPGDP